MSETATRETVPSAEAAQRLGLTREQVIRRIQTGALEGFRLPSGYWRVYADQVPR